MTTNPPRIEWCVPAYLPSVKPPLTDAAIRAAQETLGLRLPSEYIAALRVQNGGYLRHGWRGYTTSDLWGIGPGYRSILAGSVAQRFAEVDDVWLPRRANKLVPFTGDGHWYLCFDGRTSSDKPAIAYVDIESEAHRVVAPSFAAFLQDALLVRDEEPCVGLVTPLGLEDAAHRLGAALRMTISHQDAWAHGYEMFFGSADNAASQVWISRNEVARGYVRDDDDEEEYRAVADLLRGVGLRYREHPDCALIVEARDLPTDKLLAGCGRAGLVARVL